MREIFRIIEFLRKKLKALKYLLTLQKDTIPTNLKEAIERLNYVIPDYSKIRYMCIYFSSDDFSAFEFLGLGKDIKENWLYRGSKLRKYFKSIGIKNENTMIEITLKSFYESIRC